MDKRLLVDLKLHVLCQGIRFADGFLDRYDKQPELLEKRWAYNSSDGAAVMGSGKRVPPEFFLEDIVVGINSDSDTPWNLNYLGDVAYLCYRSEPVHPVHFPKRPHFYDEYLPSSVQGKHVATLYGGSSLGIFAYGACYYFAINKACKFCSLKPTRDSRSDHVLAVSPEMAVEVVQSALLHDPGLVTQVMINGGNRADNDVGFQRHVEMIRTICAVVHEHKARGSTVVPDVHLITFPPNDHDLLQLLQGLNISVAMNLEVWSGEIFAEICPGKETTYGHDEIFTALRRCVDVLGRGRVYTIFVGGLESRESLVQGMQTVAALGIVPVVNVFHRDPDAQLTTHPRADFEDMKQIGACLQEIYRKYGYTPFYGDCGRNSLDGEAAKGYF